MYVTLHDHLKNLFYSDLVEECFKVTDSPCFEKGPEFVWVLKIRKFLIGQTIY